jgi:5-methylcytosine-specific restriction endonuclease McrA
MMNARDLAGTIKTQLESDYGIEITVKRINLNSSNIEFLVAEKQSGCLGVGFHIIMQWRHMQLSLSTENHFVPDNIFEQWHQQLKVSLPTFLCFHNKLIEMGYPPRIKVNGNETSISSLPENIWLSLSINSTGPFTEIVDDLEFHEENILPPLSLFWGLVLSFASRQVIEETSPSDELEGEVTMQLHKKYERNKLNRKACIAIKGFACAVCGKKMSDIYGSIGEGFIEVHHVTPIASYGQPQHIDPARDLVPVCPSCHAMLHRKNPPYTVEELQKILKGLKNGT